MKGFAASKAVTAAVTLWWAVCPLGLFQGQAQNDRTSIEFVSGQFNVSENTRTVTLPLRLVGVWSGSVPTVDYATQDGTAVSGRDYVAQAGGAEVIYGWEQPLEIFVLITVLDDTLVEGEESFSVVLSNPTGGVVLGSNRTAVITIADNDTVVGAGRGANDVIRTGAMFPDGRAVIAGDFTSVDGIPRNGLALLKLDGSLDTSFNPGVAAYLQVQTLAVQPDGKVLAGGRFTNFNGMPRHGLVRLNGDGSVDADFSPNFQLTNAAAGGSVHRIAIDAAGRPVVGGYYDSVNGVGRRGIARLNRDGSLDETFAPDLFIVSTVDPIALQRDGKLLLNAHVPANLNEIFRLNTEGVSDWFHVPFTTAVAYEMIAMPDGRTVIGGYFGGLGGGGIGIYRFETDGSLDSTFTPAEAKFGAVGTGVVGWGVNALALQSDGKLVVGGAFQRLGGSARTGIARLQTDGGLDPGFTPSIDANAVVTGVFVQPAGSILITGFFTSVNNAERYCIARVNPDGKLVDALQFEPPAPLINGQMRLALKVPSPQKWLIQASTDLRTWTSIYTNAEAKTQLEFADESAPGLQQRFYRALTVP